MPLSELAKQVEITTTSLDDGITMEDNIPLSDFNKPCTRSCTHKPPKPGSDDRFPRKSTGRISYVESELSETGSESSPTRKQ